jgi:hypothetical protein
MADSHPVHSTSTPIRPEDADLYEGPRVTSDKIPIIEVQRGQAPAPNPLSGHKLVDFKYLQMILLGDREGTVRYRCARFLNGESGERCWRDDFDNPRSAVAHINSHGQVRTPDYPEEVLRLVIRLVKTYEAAGHRNYAILTAEELNKQGVPTVNGQPWNGQQVSGLYLTHKDKYRVHVRQDTVRRFASANSTTSAFTVTDVPTAKENTVPSDARRQPSAPPVTPVAQDVTLAELDRLTKQLLKDTDQLFDLIKDHANKVVGYVEVVGAKIAEAAAKPDADPEVIKKAAKWDRYLELRNLIES